MYIIPGVSVKYCPKKSPERQKEKAIRSCLAVVASCWRRAGAVST
jgi:hypothetical protein